MTSLLTLFSAYVCLNIIFNLILICLPN